jgi:SAM-dependent methyltransferase
MNEEHTRVCGSPEWAEFLQRELLPGFLGSVPLGPEMLEFGPGPGASTEWLRSRVGRLTVLEVDEEAAARLETRFAGTNVEVRTGSAAASTAFADCSFDTVGAFTMLHHVPDAATQNRLFAEALRVLRPGGLFVGSDSLPSDRLHHYHTDEVYYPVDPGTLLTRLHTIGFAHVTVIMDAHLKFLARKPPEQPDPAWIPPARPC